jgi:hypothetical protein
MIEVEIPPNSSATDKLALLSRTLGRDDDVTSDVNCTFRFTFAEHLDPHSAVPVPSINVGPVEYVASAGWLANNTVRFAPEFSYGGFRYVSCSPLCLRLRLRLRLRLHVRLRLRLRLRLHLRLRLRLRVESVACLVLIRRAKSSHTQVLASLFTYQAFIVVTAVFNSGVRLN